jgi:PIN domain nuclease of toxin-antitoxin system
MRVLIDTNIFLWYISGDKRLKLYGRNIITDMSNEIFLSMVSLWEIAIKTSLGKLELLEPFDDLIPKEIRKNEISILDIKFSHINYLIKLPFHHRDPFDRLIIAQAICENIQIIASDEIFKNYLPEIIW